MSTPELALLTQRVRDATQAEFEAQEQYDAARAAYEAADWKLAEAHSNVVAAARELSNYVVAQPEGA